MSDRPITDTLIPEWARWAALIWLVVWLPTYSYIWSPTTFLFLCDVGLVLACVGIIMQNALLMSSQAVSSLVVGLAWLIDISWTLIFGKHLIGGTEYFFDSHYPLIVRLMSIYHVALPLILLLLLRRTGYDPRAFRLQSAIAVACLIAARIISPAQNINYDLADPFFRRTWGPAPVHFLVILAFLIFAIYLPTHLVLLQIFRRPQSVRA